MTPGRRPTWLVAASLLLALARPAGARQVFRYDLDSLAYFSTHVIEGEVVGAGMRHYVNVLDFKVTRSYAGTTRVGEHVTVGLSAFRKLIPDGVFGRQEEIGAGDRLVLFLEPATSGEWKEDGIPWWPAGPGVKVIADENVTGMEQRSNPGPCVNTADEGPLDAFREKVDAAVKRVGAFRKELAERKADPVWLLDQLARRPAKEDDHVTRDGVAAALCEALAATHDAGAIRKANEMRKDHYERQLLGRK